MVFCRICTELFCLLSGIVLSNLVTQQVAGKDDGKGGGGRRNGGGGGGHEKGMQGGGRTEGTAGEMWGGDCGKRM